MLDFIIAFFLWMSYVIAMAVSITICVVIPVMLLAGCLALADWVMKLFKH